jgi:Diacylglycerol acyltransferase
LAWENVSTCKSILLYSKKSYSHFHLTKQLNRVSDASRSAVDRALSNGDRIGIVPGGIAEIFEGYPKSGTKPDEEYSIVRKGFLQLAYRHKIPVVPIYCFGSTKMFRRLNLPFLEQLSSLVRASLVVFYGVWGLPIPYRQKLLYVIGNAIYPPSTSTISNPDLAVDAMHEQFCTELHRIFDRHKEAYGWGHKSLHVLTR